MTLRLPAEKPWAPNSRSAAATTASRRRGSSRCQVAVGMVSGPLELQALVLGAGVLPVLVLQHPELPELLAQPPVTGVEQAQLLQVGNDLGEQHPAELQ